MMSLPSPDVMYRALVQRDAEFDGVFVVGVRSTGVYCRPVCPARKPLRANVEFFPTPRDAAGAGYRACLRCAPDRLQDHPDWVQRLLQRLQSPTAPRLTDREMVAMGMSPARARRYFRNHFGMTLHTYHRAQRLVTAHDQLKEGAPLLTTAFDAGYESDSGFRDAFQKLFGAPPGAARSAETAAATLLSTPLGPMLAAATDEALWFLEFFDRRGLPGQAKRLQTYLERLIVPCSNTLLDRLDEELRAYFAGTLERFTVPVAVRGTPFQEQVWKALQTIPYGTTRSYDWIAERVGCPGGSRAVGRANGDNRIAIVIPCHRVIRKDGSLSGYGGGRWRKQRLLDLEGGALGALP